MNTEMKSNWKHKPLVALAALGLVTLSSPSSATTILLGTDYLKTAYAWAPGIGELIGVPIPGFEPADTIVQRKQDCILNAVGSSCTIDIEMIALSLQSKLDPNILIREAPMLASIGSMTITRGAVRPDGTWGGTFDSFFDIFWDLSIDGGSTWSQQGIQPLTLSSVGSKWTAIPDVPMLPAYPGTPSDYFNPLVTGAVGDPNANYHLNKVADEYDFKLDYAKEQHPSGFVHVIPEPASLALLGLGLGVLGFARRRRAA